MGRESLRTGEIGQREAVKVIRGTGAFSRVGASLHYRGNQGLDVYAIRSTPQGMTFHRFEVKATRQPNVGRTPKSVLRLLKVDQHRLQEGSRLFGEDRLNKAVQAGSRMASYIRSKQVMAGRGRCWQSKDLICVVNLTTKETTFWKPFCNKTGKRVRRLVQVNL